MVGISASDTSSELVITSMTSCVGEARATNRKGKVLVFFEWNISLEIKGNLIVWINIIKCIELNIYSSYLFHGYCTDCKQKFS